MISRRVVFLTSVLATAISFFTLGTMHARRSQATAYTAQLVALRSEIQIDRVGKARTDAAVPAATAGEVEPRRDGRESALSVAARARMIAEIKQELQNE